MKRQSLHVKDSVTYDQFTKQQVIWTHGYGATDRYVTRNEWGALLLQWPVPGWKLNVIPVLPPFRSTHLLPSHWSTKKPVIRGRMVKPVEQRLGKVG